MPNIYKPFKCNKIGNRPKHIENTESQAMTDLFEWSYHNNTWLTDTVIKKYGFNASKLRTHCKTWLSNKNYGYIEQPMQTMLPDHTEEHGYISPFDIPDHVTDHADHVTDHADHVTDHVSKHGN